MEKPQEAKDRIIVALDVSSVKEAKELVTILSPYVGMFKIGLEFIYSIIGMLINRKKTFTVGDLDELRTFFEALRGKLFWDGKLADIPNTVGKASDIITASEVRMFNVHCSSADPAMKAARKAAGNAPDRPLVLGVTVLTSINFEALSQLGMVKDINIADDAEREEYKRKSVERIVTRWAILAQDCELDGVIASPKEIGPIRRNCGPDFLVVTPSVRPDWAPADDQKRAMTSGEAIRAGADYLVIGRPITKPPTEIGSPVDAAKRIAKEIEEALTERR